MDRYWILWRPHRTVSEDIARREELHGVFNDTVDIVYSVGEGPRRLHRVRESIVFEGEMNLFHRYKTPIRKMGMGAFRRILHGLTFGRHQEFVLESLLLVTLVPIILTMVIDAPVTVPVLISLELMFVLAVILTVVFLVVTTWFVSSAGFTTYSPRYHQTKQLFESTVLYLALSLILVGALYRLLVYPHLDQVSYSWTELAIGSSFVALFSALLAGAQYRVLRRSGDLQEKQDLVAEFLELVDRLKTCDHGEARDLGDQLMSAGRLIERKLGRESAMGCDDFQEELGEWLDEFSGRTPAGYKKMVGGGPGPSSLLGEMDEFWADRAAESQHIHHVLHSMNESAMQKALPRF